MSAAPEGGSRGAIVAAVTAVTIILASLIAIAVGVNRVAGKDSASGVPTAAPTPTPPPTPSPTPVPTPRPTPCDTATFGAALSPLNPPTDVHAYKAVPATTINPAKLYQLTILTAKGSMVLCLQPALAPVTVNVIVTLARNHFYDGLKFHRVVAGFVIQGGDPKGDGSGGPGFSFADELPRTSYTVGSVAMANSGKNTNGSQFFICLPSAPGSTSSCTTLPHLYNLFGALQSGIDVATRITQGDVMSAVTVREQQ
jgi:cyclophilin family peptidyl-prolyl cis-trans isomerase